ncbi:MAG TPA: GTPase Era [Gaiellales bacterium]|nr:GTPase Era [Gaiellales bacterium]
MTPPAHRSGVVALAGRPNVGKSTLVNRLVGEHVAAVSQKPQTTRRRALGIVTRPGYQLILADLPGFQKPFDRLTERMQRAVDGALADADVTVLVLDCRSPVGPGDRHIAARLQAEPQTPWLVAVNKVDGLGPERVLPALEAAAGLGEPRSIHPVSALTGAGVDELVTEVVALLPEGPAYFPEGTTSDQPLEQRIGERVRESALDLTRDEVPHAVATEVGEIRSAGDHGRTVVEVTLICETESQKRILIGRGGAMVKAIGTAARTGVEELLGEPVFLDLRVKVRPRWRRDSATLDRLGV